MKASIDKGPRGVRLNISESHLSLENMQRII